MTMKNSLIALLLLFSLGAVAQKAEKVYGRARVNKSIEYYKGQISAWQKIIDKDPKNAEAWYNVYNAKRILNYADTTDTRDYEMRWKDLNSFVDQMGKVVPESYEYNVAKYSCTSFSEKDEVYIKKAAVLGDPAGKTDHLDYMINISEMSRNTAERNKYAKMKKDRNEMSAGMLSYNYNVLSGLATNCILLTAGDNDTYPAWTLQGMGIREDVHVLNISLLSVERYRKKVFAELGIPQIANQPNATNQPVDLEKLVKHMAGNSKGYPVAVALTASSCKPLITPVESDLYLTGLVYDYSTEPIDNIAVLRRNFEFRYKLDYVANHFYTDISEEMVDMMNQNYIIPLSKLYEHYTYAGEDNKAMKIEEYLEKVLPPVSEAEKKEFLQSLKKN